MRKEKVPPLLIEPAFFEDEKVKAMQGIWGFGAGLIIIRIWVALWGREGATMTRKLLPGVALSCQMTKEQMDKFVEDCAGVDLFQLTEDTISSKALLDRWNAWLEKKNKRSVSAQSRWNNTFPQPKQETPQKEVQTPQKSECAKKVCKTDANAYQNANKCDAKEMQKHAFPVYDSCILNVDLEKGVQGEKPFLNLDHLRLTKPEFDLLLISYWHNDEKSLRAECEDASDWLANHKDTQVSDFVAFMRRWKRRGMEFRKGAPPANAAAPPEKSKQKLGTGAALRMVRSAKSATDLPELLQEVVKAAGFSKLKSTDGHERGVAEAKFLQLWGRA